MAYNFAQVSIIYWYGFGARLQLEVILMAFWYWCQISSFFSYIVMYMLFCSAFNKNNIFQNVSMSTRKLRQPDYLYTSRVTRSMLGDNTVFFSHLGYSVMQ